MENAFTIYRARRNFGFDHAKFEVAASQPVSRNRSANLMLTGLTPILAYKLFKGRHRYAVVDDDRRFDLWERSQQQALQKALESASIEL